MVLSRGQYRTDDAGCPVRGLTPSRPFRRPVRQGDAGDRACRVVVGWSDAAVGEDLDDGPPPFPVSAVWIRGARLAGVDHHARAGLPDQHAVVGGHFLVAAHARPFAFVLLRFQHVSVCGRRALAVHRFVLGGGFPGGLPDRSPPGFPWRLSPGEADAFQGGDPAAAAPALTLVAVDAGRARDVLYQRDSRLVDDDAAAGVHGLAALAADARVLVRPLLGGVP